MGEDISRHLIATTDKEKGNLIKIARQEHLTTFIVPDGVGGRFSELCPVGLVAAAVCGIDIRALLAGAALFLLLVLAAWRQLIDMPSKGEEL